MTIKKLSPYGVAGGNFNTAWEAVMSTYSPRDESIIPTPILNNDNIFSQEIKDAAHILDFGAGCGRNANYILENTNCEYHAVEPNQSMLNFFWNYVDKEKYEHRIHLHNDFSTIDSNIRFGAVLSLFVLQHLGYRNTPEQMNATEIYKEIEKFTTDETVFVLYEHDREEPGWIFRFLSENDILPQIYIKEYKGFPRHSDRGEHDLIVWKRSRY